MVSSTTGLCRATPCPGWNSSLIEEWFERVSVLGEIGVEAGIQDTGMLARTIGMMLKKCLRNPSVKGGCIPKIRQQNPQRKNVSL